MAEHEQEPKKRSGPEGPGPDATPSVVVSHLDIVYRIYGAKRRGNAAGGGTSMVRRALNRGRDIGAMHEVHAVKDVSFVARHGESIGIIGRNGSGKSTLLRAVAGLIPPSKGRVWVAGDPALLGVNAVLMSKLTGARNIYIGGQALGLTKEQIDERFDDIVEFSGIGDFVNLPMSAYSSGMAARLRFAISTAVTPDVLMVDEALATGDAEFKRRSQKRIARIRENAGTVFLVSHSDGTILQSCTRALWMDGGRLVGDGPSAEVVEAYRASLPAARRAARKGAAKGGQRGGNRPGAPGAAARRMARMRAAEGAEGAATDAGASSAASSAEDGLPGSGSGQAGDGQAGSTGATSSQTGSAGTAPDRASGRSGAPTNGSTGRGSRSEERKGADPAAADAPTPQQPGGQADEPSGRPPSGETPDSTSVQDRPTGPVTEDEDQRSPTSRER